MDAMTKQILTNIKHRACTSMMIETADRIFILNYVSQYRVSGYVYRKIGNNFSNFKQVNIQKTKSGKRFIMADRIRFDAEKIKPYTIAREIVECELTLAMHERHVILDIQQSGQDIGYALENQDFFIKNLTDYLEAEQKEKPLGSGKNTPQL